MRCVYPSCMMGGQGCDDENECMREKQPDSGGNRFYDYISVEEHEAAEITLKTKDKFSDLTVNEIVVLRHKAKELGIISDIVDHEDRLALIRCLFYHIELLDKRMKEINDHNRKSR